MQKEQLNQEKSKYEIRFLELVNEMAPELIPGMRPEYYFSETRNFRSDFGWPEEKVLVEIEGGIFRRNSCKYTNPMGYHRNAMKCNKAASLGFLVLRFTPLHFQKQPILMMSEVLKAVGRWKTSELRKKCLKIKREAGR